MTRWRSFAEDPPRARDALAVWLVALGLRALVVIWAAARFPPAADGTYYHVIATRIAQGLGYTWLWPDGAVTYAAHYPVGYPALIGGLYALFGESPSIAMGVNALIGSAAAPAAYAVAASTAPRAGALLAALLVALHPALVFYTPALMTEGVVASLLVVAVWLTIVARRRGAGWIAALGLLLGICTLIRPQTLLAAPVLGLIATDGSFRRRALMAIGTTLVAIAVCLPWTFRNCARMDRCVLVSANAGWNLLIGSSPSAGGTFAPVADEIVPAECRTVFAEAEKDACFGKAALREIARAPLDWLALAPRKLAYTFDFGGAAGWYLNTSNPSVFPERAKVGLGVVETLWQRGVLVLALAALGLARGPRPRLRRALALVFALSVVTPNAWLGYLGLVVIAASLGRAVFTHPGAAGVIAAVGSTAIAHAAFFGAGRYGLVCYAVVCALSGAALRRRDGF